jgi:hypothetical protein
VATSGALTFGVHIGQQNLAMAAGWPRGQERHNATTSQLVGAGEHPLLRAKGKIDRNVTTGASLGGVLVTKRRTDPTGTTLPTPGTPLADVDAGSDLI